MSTSVMSMPHTEKSGGIASDGSSPHSPINHVTDSATLVLPPSSLRHNNSGDKPRLLGMPGSGLRISFASDTSFAERKLRTRGSSKGHAASLNLRPLEAGEKPQSVRIKLPKATNSFHPKHVSLLATSIQEDLMHPRRALDIARSYGVPKYFLRGNTQILTDGRMRLFADNVWKKERMSPPQDGSNTHRKSTEKSDVICRLMDSVDKAIATSERPQQDFSATVGLGDADGTVGGLRLDNSSAGGGTAAERERSVLRDRFVSFPDVLTKVSMMDDQRIMSASKQDIDSKPALDDRKQSASQQNIGGTEEGVGEREQRGERLGEADTESYIGLNSAIRPHTVDTAITGYLPRVSHFREQAGSFSNSNRGLGIPEDKAENGTENRGVKSLSSQAAGIRLRQYRGVADSLDSALNSGGPPTTPSNNINNRVGVLFGGKYRNVLPRFYPAVSAHHVRQREAALRLGGGVRFTTIAAAGGQKRVGALEANTASSPAQHPPRRLVRFADAPHLVRFSKETAVLSPATAGVFKPTAFSGKRKEDSMVDSGVLVASRAPVQSVQRSLDSHSGLARVEWSRAGRVPKCPSTAQRLPAATAQVPASNSFFITKSLDAEPIQDSASAVPATDKLIS